MIKEDLAANITLQWLMMDTYVQPQTGFDFVLSVAHQTGKIIVVHVLPHDVLF